MVTDAPPVRLLHSTNSAAAQLGVSRSTLYLLLRADEIESVQIGARRLVSHDALVAYVARLRAGSGGDRQ